MIVFAHLATYVWLCMEDLSAAINKFRICSTTHNQTRAFGSGMFYSLSYEKSTIISLK